LQSKLEHLNSIKLTLTSVMRLINGQGRKNNPLEDYRNKINGHYNLPREDWRDVVDRCCVDCDSHSGRWKERRR
jgi:hypothetical protein